MPQIAEVLKKYMEAEGIPQAKLAKELGGVPPTTINTWINKNVFPRRRKHQLALRVKFPELFGEEPLSRKEKTFTPKSESMILNTQELRGKTTRLKLVLLLLMDEFEWLVNAKSEEREFIRQHIGSVADIQYLGGLLTMFGSEESFKDWKELSTVSFTSFNERERRKP